MSGRANRSLTPRQRRVVLRLVLGSVTLIGLVFVLFFPLQAIAAQRREASRVAGEVQVLRVENARLTATADRLNTDAEIERLARARFHLVRPGETAYVVTQAPEGTPPITYAPTTTTTRPPTTTTTKAVVVTTTTKTGGTKSGGTTTTTARTTTTRAAG
ncbi:MAG: FtsB family cell division protein [Acidimicrobiia bacterium]